MKKYLILLLITVLVVSCSSSNDDVSQNSNTLNPPDWIKGTWAYKSGSPGEYTYTPIYNFKNNDFCSIIGNTEFCTMQSQGSMSVIKVTETKTDTDYKFSFTVQGITTSYHFIKISNTKIEYVKPVQGISLNQELFKQ